MMKVRSDCDHYDGINLHKLEQGTTDPELQPIIVSPSVTAVSSTVNSLVSKTIHSTYNDVINSPLLQSLNIKKQCGGVYCGGGRCITPDRQCIRHLLHPILHPPQWS